MDDYHLYHYPKALFRFTGLLLNFSSTCVIIISCLGQKIAKSGKFFD